MRQFLGYNLFHAVRKLSEHSTSDARRKAKQFTIDEVTQKILRINAVYAAHHPAKVQVPSDEDLHRPRMFSGNTLKISQN
jgi:hypothetical protein